MSGLDEIFDLNLNLVKPKCISIFCNEIEKKPLYFKEAALVLLEAYKNKPNKVKNEISRDLGLHAIKPQIYNCLYFLNKYSENKFKFDLDSSGNITFKYKDFKEWHDKLLMDIYKEKLYFDN